MAMGQYITLYITSLNFYNRYKLYLILSITIFVAQDIVTSEYTGHDMLADEIAVFYGNERDLKVLDVGAGTGGLGKAVSRPRTSPQRQQREWYRLQ